MSTSTDTKTMARTLMVTGMKYTEALRAVQAGVRTVTRDYRGEKIHEIDVQHADEGAARSVMTRLDALVQDRKDTDTAQPAIYLYVTAHEAPHIPGNVLRGGRVTGVTVVKSESPLDVFNKSPFTPYKAVAPDAGTDKPRVNVDAVDAGDLDPFRLAEQLGVKERERLTQGIRDAMSQDTTGRHYPFWIGDGTGKGLPAEELRHLARKARTAHYASPDSEDGLSDIQPPLQPLLTRRNTLVAGNAASGCTLFLHHLADGAASAEWDVTVIEHKAAAFGDIGAGARIEHFGPESGGARALSDEAAFFDEITPGTAQTPRLVIVDSADYLWVPPALEPQEDTDARTAITQRLGDLMDDPNTVVAMRSMNPRGALPEDLTPRFTLRVLMGRASKAAKMWMFGTSDGPDAPTPDPGYCSGVMAQMVGDPQVGSAFQPFQVKHTRPAPYGPEPSLVRLNGRRTRAVGTRLPLGINTVPKGDARTVVHCEVMGNVLVAGQTMSGNTLVLRRFAATAVHSGWDVSIVQHKGQDYDDIVTQPNAELFTSDLHPHVTMHAEADFLRQITPGSKEHPRLVVMDEVMELLTPSRGEPQETTEARDVIVRRLKELMSDPNTAVVVQAQRVWQGMFHRDVLSRFTSRVLMGPAARPLDREIVLGTEYAPPAPQREGGALPGVVSEPARGLFRTFHAPMTQV